MKSQQLCTGLRANWVFCGLRRISLQGHVIFRSRTSQSNNQKRYQVISLAENATVQIFIVTYDRKNCTVYAHLPFKFIQEKYILNYFK